jgi:integrase
MIPGGCRAGAVNESVWSEVNSDKAVRTIAEERIKTGGERRVPLSDPCRGIFAEPERSQVERRCSVARDLRERRANIKSQAENSMEEALQSLAPDIILHGCHTSFRIWVVERAAFLGDGRQSAPDTEKAYRRFDLFDGALARPLQQTRTQIPCRGCHPIPRAHVAPNGGVPLGRELR